MTQINSLNPTPNNLLPVDDSPRIALGAVRTYTGRTINNNINAFNALISGSRWNLPTSRVLTYSFYEDSVWNGTYYGSQTGVREVNDAVKSNVRAMFARLETFVNIDFQEVTETSRTAPIGTLRFMLSNDPSYAYAYYPSSSSLGGDVHLKTSFQSVTNGNGFGDVPGTHGYMTLIHETGHALGLRHPHEANPPLANLDDNTSNTLMSYRFTHSPLQNAPATAMVYDIAALQSIYGSRPNETGDTSYDFTTRIDQFSVNSNLSINTPRNIKQTIWDTGGIDTLDFSNLSFQSGGYRLDMNPGGWLTSNANYKYQQSIIDPHVTKTRITTTHFTNGTAIALNVTLENLVNSTSSDTIYANAEANTFGGYTRGRSVRADTFWNTDSNDSLDLSDYSFNEVSRTKTGNDLVLRLGGTNSVTIKNYYVGPQINIAYASMHSVTLAVNPVSVTEDGSQNLVYTLTRTGNTSAPLTVNFTTTGTATANQDYTQDNIGTVTFAAGATTATVTVNPTADSTIEPDETVILTLNAGANYTVGTTTPVTGTITNDDILPTVTLAVNPETVLEDGEANLVYTLTRTGDTTNSLSVNFTTTGTATADEDYSQDNIGTVTFAAGATTATVTVDPTADSTVEPDETVILTLNENANYTVGTTTPVTGTIINDDLTQVISFSGVNPETVLEDGEANLVYTLTRTGDTTDSLTVNFTTTGTATADEDYTQDNIGTVTFAAGATTATVTVDPTADGTIEPDETVILTLNESANYTVGTTTPVTGTIINDDAAQVISFSGTRNTQNNIINGNSNNNVLTGTSGNDNLFGNDGNDSLIGGLGNDRITGGAGVDSFIYSSGRAYRSADFGRDNITDWTTQDQIVLSKTTFTRLHSNIGNGFSVSTEFAQVSDDTLVAANPALIVFSTASNTLFYNQNGAATGLGTGSGFVMLEGVNNLADSNFVLSA